VNKQLYLSETKLSSFIEFMPYFFNTPADTAEMLEKIGAKSVDELFDRIPTKMQLHRPLDVPPALDELQLAQHMNHLAGNNTHAGQRVCFLGAGCYDHFIPAVVDTLASRGEFYTSYTPYQPEVSQGNLQAMFEYQSLICQLTGMEVSNASLYDGGSAAVEAAMMCLAANKKRHKVIVPLSVHPEYRQIISTYFENLNAELVTVELSNGTADLKKLAAVIDDQTACVLIQSPNFFGCIEQVQQISDLAHAAGALMIQSFDPISLGLLRRPGDMGADIAIAEGQSLGSPMAYGGPFLGIMACKEELVRRMPGRIAGETVSIGDKRCWVLTLQTREQHIRRDGATSNICTNQGLYALRASIYLAQMGPFGMREVAEQCLRKSHYALQAITTQQGITKAERLEAAFSAPFFKEFVVRDLSGDVQGLLDAGRDAGLFAGVPLGKWFPDLDDCLLIAVTEKRTKSQIDLLATTLNQVNDAQEAVHA
jgi:glycine dehydrogenase subunit 1